MREEHTTVSTYMELIGLCACKSAHKIFEYGRWRTNKIHPVIHSCTSQMFYGHWAIYWSD